MSIGPDARSWFLSKYGKTNNKTYTSKYYLPEESWPKKHVWWPQIPISVIDTNRFTHVNILCQVAPGANDFHYFNVPVTFLNEHLVKLDRVNDIIHLYISAEPDTLFTEIRGTGKLDFSQFLIK
jgi:hypothetical protein